MNQDHPGAWVGYVASAVIICTVLFFRFRSMRRIRKLRLEWLWIVPALFTLVTASALYQSMPTGIQWLYVGIALALGGALGFFSATRLEMFLRAKQMLRAHLAEMFG